MGIRERYEQHHSVTITDEALKAAADLSTATSPTASCRTRPSTSSTRPRRACACATPSAPPALREARRTSSGHQGEGSGDQRPGVRGGGRRCATRPQLRETRRRAARPSGSPRVGRPAGRRRGGHRRDRRDVDRHPGHAHRPGGVASACSTWRRRCTSGSSARTRRSRSSRKAVRRARAGLKDPSGRSARSSSSARPASARPSSRRRSPSSCSAARTR